MEATSQTSRFIFTAQTPSRLIDALRSRTQHIRLTGVPRKQIESKLAELCASAGVEPVRAFLATLLTFRTEIFEKPSSQLKFSHFEIFLVNEVISTVFLQ